MVVWKFIFLSTQSLNYGVCVWKFAVCINRLHASNLDFSVGLCQLVLAPRRYRK